ncbi:MAG: 1,2-phenylacetyl-CoA epoxidase subunit PaaD, partial [Pseudomonadota bacterium]
MNNVHAMEDPSTKIWRALAEVSDPEIPVLSVLDLGIVRSVDVAKDGGVTIAITPTYSGCPAMDTISKDIVAHLTSQGVLDCTIEHVLSPPWSSEWLTDSGREKLRRYGITPPDEEGFSKRALLGFEPQVSCPKCRSSKTRKISEFGSTPCKAHYVCDS